MALDGGGGGGGPLGFTNSFVGPAEALELVGDHAYAYSGQVDLASTEKTMLSFTSGNYYFVGDWQMLYDGSGFSAGEAMGYTIKMNGTTVARAEIAQGTSAIDSIMRQVPIIIPAYTKVEILGDTDAGNIVVVGLLTGRIYK
jgi:hypothetical protein